MSTCPSLPFYGSAAAEYVHRKPKKSITTTVLIGCTHTHTHTHIYLTKQVTRKGEAPIVLATRDRLTGKKEIDRITNKLRKQLLL